MYPSQQQQTVQLQIQVIDLEPQSLLLEVPTYLPAHDLTQRIVRDGGLLAHWDNGQRRLYWLRARGRLLRDKETLGDLGVVPGELVYLLPEPPHGSGVVEQSPEYPENHPYAGSGFVTLLGTLALITAWAVGWGVMLSVDSSIWGIVFPGLGLGLLCCSFARHAWGGAGDQPQVALTGLVMLWMMTALTLVVGWGLDLMGLFPVPLEAKQGPFLGLIARTFPGIVTGMLGVFIGWLAWWGAVEPLPETRVVAAEDAPKAVVTVPCGICGGDVTADVRQDCLHGCGQHFHVGCYRARVSVHRGDNRTCAVCNRAVG